MVTLQDIKNLLESTINSLEKTIASEEELDRSYIQFMENAKASEIGGLKNPDMIPYIQQLNLQKQILLTLKFRVECQIEDNKKIIGYK